MCIRDSSVAVTEPVVSVVSIVVDDDEIKGESKDTRNACRRRWNTFIDREYVQVG